MLLFTCKSISNTPLPIYTKKNMNWESNKKNNILIKYSVKQIIWCWLFWKYLLHKIEKIGYHAKIDRNFCTNWCECSNHGNDYWCKIIRVIVEDDVLSQSVLKMTYSLNQFLVLDAFFQRVFVVLHIV